MCKTLHGNAGLLFLAPILFSFRLTVCYARPIYIYIYIIHVPTHNRNNEFIIYIPRKKMADLERRLLRRPSNASAGGQQHHEFLNSNYLFLKWGFPQCVGAIDGTHIPIIAPKENALDYFNCKIVSITKANRLQPSLSP